MITVTDFGADPTGKNDSANAINAAIKAAPENSQVFFPAGIYLTNRQIRIHKSGLLFGGLEGQNPVIKPSLPDDEPGIIVSGSMTLDSGEVIDTQLKDVRITDITIDGGRKQLGSRPSLEYGIYVARQVENLWITRSTVQHCSHAAIRISDNTPYSLKGVKIINCLLQSVSGFDLDNGGFHTGQGIELFVCTDVLMNGNSIRSCSGHGIRIIGCRDSEFVFNRIRDCHNGFSIQVDGSGGFPCHPTEGQLWRITKNISAKSNTIYRCIRAVEIREGTSNILFENNDIEISSSYATSFHIYKAEGPNTSGWPQENIRIIDNNIKVN